MPRASWFLTEVCLQSIRISLTVKSPKVTFLGAGFVPESFGGLLQGGTPWGRPLSLQEIWRGLLFWFRLDVHRVRCRRFWRFRWTCPTRTHRQRRWLHLRNINPQCCFNWSSWRWSHWIRPIYFRLSWHNWCNGHFPRYQCDRWYP